MPHGLPDFWQGTIASMPAIGAGQVAWYMSDAELVDGEGHKDLINYVVPDLFELHVCSGVVSCGLPRLQRYDLRQTPAATWISPTSHSDPDSKWLSEEKAYDSNTATWAAHFTDPDSWTSYLILLVNEAYIDKIRFFAIYDPTNQDKIDVDVYYEGAWHDVYEGAFANLAWVEKDIPAGTKLVSKARFRLYNVSDSSLGCELREFQFNTSAVTPQEGMYFDTYALIPYLPQAPYIVEPGATFAVRVYNDDEDSQNMSVALGGFLQKKTM